MPIIRVLQDYIPFLGIIFVSYSRWCYPTVCLSMVIASLVDQPDERAQNLAKAQEVMNRIARKLIADKKQAILTDSSEESGSVERKDVHGRDLLTLLIKANMASDIPEDQRLSDDEVLARE